MVDRVPLLQPTVKSLGKTRPAGRTSTDRASPFERREGDAMPRFLNSPSNGSAKIREFFQRYWTIALPFN